MRIVHVEASNDAGLFFCESQLFCSLAELYKKDKPARADFLQVPADRSKEGIEKSAKVASNLVLKFVGEMRES